VHVFVILSPLCPPASPLPPAPSHPSQGDALCVMFMSPNHAAQSNIPQNNANAVPNGHHPPKPPSQPKETIHVVGIPAVSIHNGRLVVGDASSSACLPSPCTPLSLHPLPFFTLTGSPRSYTPIKTLGDGSFGTVLLCDWHGTLPPCTPLSPMQCGGGARPEWAGKRLVAVKRMKKKWEGGWDECKKLKELEVRPSCLFFRPLPTHVSRM